MYGSMTIKPVIVTIVRGIMAASVLIGTATAADFNGIFSWSDDPADHASISQAVDHAASQVNAVIRPVVRKRLAASIVPYELIEMVVTNGIITFNRNSSDRPITTEIGGKAVQYARTDGKLSDVTFAMEGEKLRQTYSNDEGTRENLFSLAEEGRILTMAITIRPTRVKTVIELTLTYVKNGS